MLTTFLLFVLNTSQLSFFPPVVATKSQSAAGLLQWRPIT